MADVETTSSPSGRLLELAGRLERQEGFDRVVAALEAGEMAALDGVWGSSCALAAAALAGHGPGPLVVVCPNADDVDNVAEDLKLFATFTAEKFAALESLPGDRVIADEVFGDRIRLIKRLTSDGPPELVVTSIQALLQPVPDRATLKRQSRRLAVGDEIAIEDLSRWLIENGFHNTSAVELPGEVSVRGGLVDLFAHDWFDPVRVEFFGDRIESIRRFEVAGQRSLARVGNHGKNLSTVGQRKTSREGAIGLGGYRLAF